MKSCIYFEGLQIAGAAKAIEATMETQKLENKTKTKQNSWSVWLIKILTLPLVEFLLNVQNVLNEYCVTEAVFVFTHQSHVLFYCLYIKILSLVREKKNTFR